jgi:hypothetical protein
MLRVDKRSCHAIWNPPLPDDHWPLGFSRSFGVTDAESFSTSSICLEGHVSPVHIIGSNPLWSGGFEKQPSAVIIVVVRQLKEPPVHRAVVVPFRGAQDLPGSCP